MKKRIVRIEVVYDITDVPEELLPSISEATTIAYLDFQESLFMEDEGLFNYKITVEDIEE